MARFLSTMLVGIGIWCLCSVNLDLHAKIDPVDPAPEVPRVQSTRIALVDMAQVFKRSMIFEQKREALKLKIKDSEEAAQRLVKLIDVTTRKLGVLEKGSEDHQQTEVALQRQKKEFEDFRVSKSRDFLKEESGIYREVYALVTKTISDYAQTHGIDLVMRHNAENPLNEEDPKKLLEMMNKQVVYDNNLDITEAIIDIVNDR